RKLRDIVGRYLNPPAKALVLSVDEKSQIQALDRTQPILPLRPGIPARQTHDYERHGTTTLFAALNILEGHVIDRCQSHHTHTEFIAFLDTIAGQTPRRRDIHLILDNYGTHKHPAVKAWLTDHPRFHFHFTPTGASWLNLVERFFAEITRKRLRRSTLFIRRYGLGADAGVYGTLVSPDNEITGIFAAPTYPTGGTREDPLLRRLQAGSAEG